MFEWLWKKIEEKISEKIAVFLCMRSWGENFKKILRKPWERFVMF